MTTYTGIKFKVETSAKERDQKLLYSISIEMLKVEQQHISSQYIITLPMNPIINSSFNEHPMSWDLIHRRLLHLSYSVMIAICRHKNPDGLPKHCPKKVHKAPCTIYYTAKTTTINKVTTVDTSNLQPGELVHMVFAFYSLASIRGFASMLIVVCAKTRMIWVFPTVSKRAPVFIIPFILTTFMDENTHTNV